MSCDDISRLPSPVSRLPSPVSRLPSPVSRLPSPVSHLFDLQLYNATIYLMVTPSENTFHARFSKTRVNDLLSDLQVILYIEGLDRTQNRYQLVGYPIQKCECINSQCGHSKSLFHSSWVSFLLFVIIL